MIDLARHDFLVLALLCAVPSAIIYALRPDLRRAMRVMGLAALPFALTEQFFYPTYWSPRFLFGLERLFGFGLEDLIFVVALAGFTTTAYAFVFRRALVPRAGKAPSPRGATMALAFVLVVALGLHLAGLAMIYACLAAMTLGATALCTRRPELTRPALLGGLISVALYATICAVFAQLIPGVFARVWHTDALLDRFVAGIPLEELAYGFVAGAIATAFLPTALELEFAPRRPGRPDHPM